MSNYNIISDWKKMNVKDSVSTIRNEDEVMLEITQADGDRLAFRMTVDEAKHLGRMLTSKVELIRTETD